LKSFEGDFGLNYEYIRRFYGGPNCIWPLFLA